MNNNIMINKRDNINKIPFESIFGKWIYRILSLLLKPIEAILRSNFGERYFSLLGTIGLVFPLIFLIGILGISGSNSNFSILSSDISHAQSRYNIDPCETYPRPAGCGRSISDSTINTLFFVRNIFTLFCLVSFGFIVWRHIEIFLRNRKGIKWNSYSSGVSYSFVRRLSNNKFFNSLLGQDFSARFASKMITEPLLVLAFAIVLSVINPIFFITFGMAAFLIFLKEYLDYRFQRDQFLDIVDSELDLIEIKKDLKIGSEGDINEYSIVV
ncbi:MAG: hypothetical protein ACRCXZ_05325 [Patescibacteria group bacterium]